MKGVVKDASTGMSIQGAQIKVFNITGNRKIEHDITSGTLIFLLFVVRNNFIYLFIFRIVYNC